MRTRTWLGKAVYWWGGCCAVTLAQYTTSFWGAAAVGMALWLAADIIACLSEGT